MPIQLPLDQRSIPFATRVRHRKSGFFGKNRRSYRTQLAMPARRFRKHPNVKIYMWRRIILLVAVLVTVAFIGKIVLGFFNAEYVSLELSGNIHYTDVEIYDVLAEKLENIVIDSEEQTSDYLKTRLSYIKEARVAKHVMKRTLTIEISERDPFAILQFRPRSQTAPSSPMEPFPALRESEGAFFLVDTEGHVLKNIEVPKTEATEMEMLEDMVILQVMSQEHPKIGGIVEKDDVKFGLTVLKRALLNEAWLAAQINAVDASDARKIKLYLESLPMPVWIAGDSLETGLRHTALLLKQHKPRLLEFAAGEERRKAEQYLDARFEDTLYLGGAPEDN